MTAKHKVSFAPEGSRYERLHAPKVPKSPIKRFKKFLSRTFTSLCCLVLPPVYKLWMWLVWRTSTIEANFEHIRKPDGQHQGLIAAMWHEDALMAPHLFSSLRAYTLASTARIGRVIASVLEAHNFKVFRGGTGHSRKGRRRSLALRNMIYYLRQNPNSRCGIAVDGTKGPARKLKPGIVKIAQECGIPIFLVNTEVRRSLKLPTWDKTIVPLPFNRIRTQFVGPYWVEPEASGAERETFRRHIETELTRLSGHMAAQVKSGRADAKHAGEFVPRAYSPLDLQRATIPAWARDQDASQPKPADSSKNNVTADTWNKNTGSKRFCLLAMFLLLPLALDATPLF
ncbi:MAG: DUF374 domain-containing protein [Puniceicoccaceae bacterium]|nr:MAG: DUF374 domain-containing protein [Puniceicoccaceae bacterium]